ncbi:hypothetical protein BH11ACT5_BH11ACT5_15740 [soil metagenome]
MTDTMARGSLTTSTDGAPTRRGPAYAVIAECLRIQSTARRQSRLAWLFGRDPILPDARSWYRGAIGEIQVAKTLGALSPGWTVLYNLDGSPEASILIVGPAGAFTIATRNHSRQRVVVGADQLLVNGHRTHHIRDARYEARRLSHLLGVVVTPIIAVVDPAALTITERADGVEVLVSSQLAGFIARRKPRLTDDTVASLVERAGLDGSWSADVVDETLVHEARFARLKGDVGSALHRRMVWIGLAGFSVPMVVVTSRLLGSA